MSGPEVRRRGPHWGRLGLIVVAVAALVGIVAGVQALSAPVERAGTPTMPVPAPTGTRFTSPSPSPSSSTTPTTSGSASPTGTASSSPRSTMKSSGAFNWASVTASAAGSQGKLYRYAVAVETSAALKADSVATTISGVLNDPRSWTGAGDVRFALVARSKATVNLYLASAKTAATLCGSDDGAADACTDGDTVVINAERWKSTAAGYAGNTAGYRAYLINHAVGQLLGEKAASCPGKGKKAPVTMEQSGDLRGCVANPWP
ncbi:MAG: DUF3152 domain-containing protein [Micropruina sp.]|uniref:DUF3152 domain-containing protein n=1 Tax=Micropruina sp. TaxID=2737536 RepID=UPI0039E44008